MKSEPHELEAALALGALAGTLHVPSASDAYDRLPISHAAPAADAMHATPNDDRESRGLPTYRADPLTALEPADRLSSAVRDANSRPSELASLACSRGRRMVRAAVLSAHDGKAAPLVNAFSAEAAASTLSGLFRKQPIGPKPRCAPRNASLAVAADDLDADAADAAAADSDDDDSEERSDEEGDDGNDDDDDDEDEDDDEVEVERNPAVLRARDTRLPSARAKPPKARAGADVPKARGAVDYFGVHHHVTHSRLNPFMAQIQFKKKHSLGVYPTAKAAARAYDAIARLIPGRALNFNHSHVGAGAGQGGGKAAGGAQRDADVLAAIEAIRSHSAGAQPKGAAKYFGVTFDERLKLNSYQAHIYHAGKKISCGCHPTPKAAALAYDKAAAKIPGKRLNFPADAHTAVAAGAVKPPKADGQRKGGGAAAKRAAPVRPFGRAPTLPLSRALPRKREAAEDLSDAQPPARHARLTREPAVLASRSAPLLGRAGLVA